MDLIITESKGFVVRIYYKSIGLIWNKQKMEAVAGLQAFLHLELHLHRQHLSIARASKLQSYHPSSLASNSWSDPASCQTIPKDGISSRHHPYASFKWMQRYKSSQGIGWGLLCKQQARITSNHLNAGYSGIPDSRSFISIKESKNPPSRFENSLSLTSAAIQARKWTRGR